MNALVVEGSSTRGILAAARALAAAGHRVTIGCPQPYGLAYWSKATTSWEPVPAVEDGHEAFVDGVAEAVRRRKIDIVFCTGDAESLALTLLRDRVDAVVPLPAYDIVKRAIDKLDLTESAIAGGLLAPRTELPSPEAYASFAGGPVMVKARLHWSPETAGTVSRLEAELCADTAAAAEVVERFRAAGAEPVLQEVVSYGAPMHVHTVCGLDSEMLTAVVQDGPPLFFPPPAGRRTRARVRQLDPELEAGVRRTLRAMGWTGFGSLCFLMDEKGRAYFVDFNGRIPMSLDADVRAAGVDVMSLWLDVAMGRPIPAIPAPRIGARHHWLEGDFKRALRERRGGLVRDVLGTLRYAVGATHTVLRPDDPSPALHQLGLLVRRRLPGGGRKQVGGAP